jgi:hypothetical protein
MGSHRNCDDRPLYTNDEKPFYLKTHRELLDENKIPTSEPQAFLQMGESTVPLYDMKSAVSKEYLQIALDTRELELNLLWQRSLFFVGFVVAAAAAIPDLVKSDDYWLLTIVTGVGLISSIGWVMINMASKYWAENWETKIFQNSEIKTLFQPLKLSNKKFFARRISVSKLTITFSIVVTILWAIGFGFSLYSVDISCLGAIFYTIVLVSLSSWFLWLISKSED